MHLQHALIAAAVAAFVLYLIFRNRDGGDGDDSSPVLVGGGTGGSPLNPIGFHMPEASHA